PHELEGPARRPVRRSAAAAGMAAEDLPPRRQGRPPGLRLALAPPQAAGLLRRAARGDRPPLLRRVPRPPRPALPLRPLRRLAPAARLDHLPLVDGHPRLRGLR